MYTNKKQAALFAQSTIDITLAQLMETLYAGNISPCQYNQICIYNEIIKEALLKGGIAEARLNIYETGTIAIVNSKYLQIRV